MTHASDIERQLADLANAERTSRGLAPLQLELRLNLAAERHSKWMIETGNISNVGGRRLGAFRPDAGRRIQHHRRIQDRRKHRRHSGSAARRATPTR